MANTSQTTSQTTKEYNPALFPTGNSQTASQTTAEYPST